MSSLNKKFHKVLNIAEPYTEDPIDAEELFNESEMSINNYYKTFNIKVDNACAKFYKNWGFAFDNNPIIEKAIKRLASKMYDLGHADGYADGIYIGEKIGYDEGCCEGYDY